MINFTVWEAEGYAIFRGVVVEAFFGGVEILKAVDVVDDAQPGEAASSTVELLNPFSRDLIFNISVSRVSWLMVVKLGGKEVSLVRLVPGSSAQLNVDVYVPDDSGEGWYSLTLSTGAPVFSQSLDALLYVGGRADARVGDRHASIDTVSGSIATYVVRIGNQETANAEVGFQVEGCKGTTSFTWRILRETGFLSCLSGRATLKALSSGLRRPLKLGLSIYRLHLLWLPAMPRTH